MAFNYITWNVAPEIFSIGSLSVRWYGLLFASSFFFGYLILMQIFRKEKIEIKYLDELTTYMIIGTVVGARLGHCFFYEPAYYLANPMKIFMVWQGGLASHGAAIGIILTMVFVRKAFRVDVKKEAEAFGWCKIIFGVPTLLGKPWSMVDPILIAFPLSMLVAVVVSYLTQPPSKEHVAACFKYIGKK